VGTLAPLTPEALVYPVKPDSPKARAPSIVVSSGSYGGGGLRMYGVLHGNKIYTVYFSMPGNTWILQYCAREPGTQVDPASRVVQMQMQPLLTPPAALEQFDFHRPPEQQTSARILIILHGFIHEDGSVSDLEVVQSHDPTSDAAARAAFSRWKFKPALRAGAPVALEILVGIP
jgi:TonB family protein